MITNTASYAGLMEHREVLTSLCGAVLLRAARDGAYFEQNPKGQLEGTTDNAESLDKWFESSWCECMCQAVDMHTAFAGVDWRKTSQKIRVEVANHGK